MPQGNITAPDSGSLNTDARKYAAERGWAMQDGSYPIRPADMHGRADLEKAVRAVGRGGGSHDAIRRHIIKRARALGLSDMIPDNWAADGSLRAVDDESGSSLETQYRSFVPDLEVRSGGDGRTIFGIAVPYNAPTRIDDRLVESFARGAFNHQINAPQRVKFAREHQKLGGELIGAASMLRDDLAGLYVELRAARTAKGDETLELVKDGALDQLSVAFRERQSRRLAGGVTERVKADLFEIAVVTEGAYGELAMAAGVRSKQIPQAALDLDLRAQADEYLHGLPKPKDYDLEVRKIRLGLPY